jgi:hypothetical protein
VTRKLLSALVSAALILAVPAGAPVAAFAQVVGAASRAAATGATAGRVSLPSAIAPGFALAPSPILAPSLAPALAAAPAAPSGVAGFATTAAAARVPALAAAAANSSPAAIGSPAPVSAETSAVEASVRFDQSVVHASALDDLAVPAASAPDERPSGLEPAKAPESGASAEPPAPRKPLPRSLWGLFWGHHIITVFGINLHVLSLPFLVKDGMGLGASAMGLARNIHMGGMALVGLLPVAALLDKTDYRVVYIATSVGRTLMMGAIPLLFMSGTFPFTALALIVAANSVFQSVMLIADSAGRKAFVGKDETLNKDAAATLGKWDSVAGALMPLAAGAIIGALVQAAGLGGYALAYGIYAGLLLAAVPFYWRMVRDPRFPANDSMGMREAAVQGATFLGALIASLFTPFLAVLRWAWRSFVPAERPAFPVPYGGKTAGETLRKLGAALAWTARESLVLAAGALLLVPAMLKALSRLPGAIRAARESARPLPEGMGRGERLRHRMADLLDRNPSGQGLAAILRNRILSILTMVMALEVFLIDALPFVLVPSLITDALGASPVAWLASAGTIMGLIFSLEYLGRFIPAHRLEGERGDELIKKRGHGTFYRRAAVASLLFWALLIPMTLTTGMFWVNLAIMAAVFFTVQLFHSPVSIVMEPVKRREMPDDKLNRIESSILMVDLAFESIGALLIGLILDLYGLLPALIVTASFLTLTAVLQWMVPKWIFPDGNHPAPRP